MSEANIRLILLASHARYVTDPVEAADVQTSIADARIAVCAAAGVDLDDVHPATGFNYSRASYERVRDSWRDLVRQGVYSPRGDGPAYRRALELWKKARPEWVAADGGGWIDEDQASSDLYA